MGRASRRKRERHLFRASVVTGRTIERGETWYCSIPGQPWRPAWWALVDNDDGTMTLQHWAHDGESGINMSFGQRGVSLRPEDRAEVMETVRRILRDTEEARRWAEEADHG